MTLAIKITRKFNGGGKDAIDSRTLQTEMVQVYDQIHPAGKAGSLTTRTGNSDGIFTSTAHGLDDTESVDVYWVGGMRRGMTVAAFDANTVTISGGVGDNLPAQGTAITLSVVNIALFTSGGVIDGLGISLKALLIQAQKEAIIRIRDAIGTELLVHRIVQGVIYEWYQESGKPNPLAGTNPSRVFVSNGSTVSNRVEITMALDTMFTS